MGPGKNTTGLLTVREVRELFREEMSSDLKATGNEVK